MITIIHGDDTASSRNYFINEKLQRLDSVILQGEKLTLTQVIEAIEGGELFITARSFFIEDFLSQKKTGKEFDDILSRFKNNQDAVTIYFWEGKVLTKKQMSFFPNATIKLFKLHQSAFAFLDSIKPGSGTRLIQLFHNALVNSDAEFIFYMLIRQFRLLLALSEKSESDQIDEVKRLAPWQKGKLQKQAQQFTKNQLISLHRKLSKLDLSLKTGKLPYSLTSAIDFLLIEI